MAYLSIHFVLSLHLHPQNNCVRYEKKRHQDFISR